MWRDCGQLIRRLRNEKALNHDELADAVGLSAGSLIKIESGRPFSSSTGASLRRELCKNSDDEAEFDATFLRASSTVPSPLMLPLDSPDAVLRIVPVPYPPFSGNDSRFLESFLKKMLDLGAIRYEVPGMIRDQTSAEQFDVTQRVDWLTKHEADVLLNLATLQRLKKIRFLMTPIRVSLNGVLLRPHQADLHRSDSALSNARALLTKANLRYLKMFRLFAIKNEVGWLHLVQHLRLPITEISTSTTLAATQLADSMRRWDGTAAPLLVCDEITAMSVLRSLAGEGMLVFQPSFDESVMSSARRSLPVYPMGIGFRRDDQELYSYMSEAIRTFLAYETEKIALLYEALYGALVEQVQNCLKNDNALFLGGARRISMEELDQTQIETLSHQNARAYARGCLQLNRKAIPESIDALGWVRVLRRARERIQWSEAKDRRSIKQVVVSMLKTVIGLDPAQKGLQFNYSSFQAAIQNQWSTLKYLLERDLDVEIPLQDARFRDGLANGDLENFVSQMQKILEASAHAANVTVINEVGPQDEKTYLKLRQQYNLAKSVDGADRPVAKSLIGTTALMARNLGAAVGFITIRATKSEVANISKVATNRIELLDIYVMEHMRELGINHRLIRELVDYADRNAADSVWFSSRSREKYILDLFLSYGFVQQDKYILAYTLDRLKTVPEIQPSKVRQITSER